MTIKILSVGQKPSHELSTLIADYTKRLPRNISIIWQYLKSSNTSNADTSKQQETESLLRAIKPAEKVILLDETGVQITNQELSALLFEDSKDIVFVIGGAYGVAKPLFDRADVVLYLSKLVLPHQIVRLVLSEQIYRSYTISINHPYHHN